MATDWRTAKVCSKCGVYCMECKKPDCDCENHAGASTYPYKHKPTFTREQQVGIDQRIIDITERVMDDPLVTRDATEEELKAQREGWAKSCVTTDGPFGKYRDYDAPKPDMVNQPPHYRAGDTYETIRVIEAWDLGFNLGNTVKYISRAGRKDEAKTLEDLKKAAWYLQREIGNLESEPALSFASAVAAAAFCPHGVTDSKSCPDCNKLQIDYNREVVRDKERDKERPKIVCLCGSTRFKDAFDEANYQETMTGNIVLSVGFFMHATGNRHGEDVGATPEQKKALDELHKRKIDLADEVFVLNGR